jgi:hypothetical protein
MHRLIPAVQFWTSSRSRPLRQPCVGAVSCKGNSQGWLVLHLSREAVGHFCAPLYISLVTIRTEQTGRHENDFYRP